MVMTHRDKAATSLVDVIDDIVATDNIELRIKGLRGLRYTLEQVLYDLNLDIGEACALKQITANNKERI